MASPPAGTRLPSEALEMFVDVLSQLDEESGPDAFYGHLCESLCEQAGMERAILFLYDGARRRVRAAGAHGIDLDAFTTVHVSVESAPTSQVALEHDRVTELDGDEPGAVPAAFTPLVKDRRLIFTPMVAGGQWVGVILSDRPKTDPPLSEDHRGLLWTLGKTAALATLSRTWTRQVEKSRQLKQRIDMTREIHDVVIQRLFGVSLALSGDGPVSDETRARCADEVQAALGDLRVALQRPLGADPRPTDTTLALEIERLASEHPDLGVELEPGSGTDVPPHLEPLAQSILAEAIRNAHKHATPERVAVRIADEDGTFVLAITNDGVDGRSAPQSGMGLRLAAFEALQFGGLVEFGAQDDDCWQVKLVVPDD